VIVDDVEDHHYSGTVCGVDQVPEIVGRDVGRMRGIGEYAVIAPATIALKGGDRHELDRGEAEIGERGGSVCLNSFGRLAKWISASIMPPPSLVPAR
jgi:hypothetical protein